MADKYAPEIAECLRNSGFIVYPSPADGHSKEAHEQTGGGIRNGKYEEGSADLLIAKNYKAVLVEVKNAGKSFPFSLWKADQRIFAEKAETEYGTPYWLAIVLGTGRPDAKDYLKFPRRAWIMSRQTFLAIENMMLRAGQKSIPYILTKKSKYKLRGNFNRIGIDMDAIRLFTGELRWEKGGWILPENHILMEYINEEQRQENLDDKSIRDYCVYQ